MQSLPTHVDSDEFATLIERETGTVELKVGAGAEPLQRAMVAFSNSGGGTILIGVSDERMVTGRRLDQGTDDAVHQAAGTAHDLGRYVVRQIFVDGRAVVAVEVSRREEGFAQTSNGRVLVRRGGRNVHLLGEDLWSFMAGRRLQRFERTSSGLQLNMADDAKLLRVRSAYGWGDNDLADRLLERHLLTDGGELTIAGALMLTHPARALGMQKAHVEVRRYRDEGPDYDRRVTFDGPVGDQVIAATKFLVDELGSDLVVTGVHRHDLPKLPSVVVREAVANAVAHRSYEEDRVNVLVQMRPDRVIITSPGRLPEPVTIETMRAAQAARNPAIIDVLRRLDLAEDAGRGVDVMQDSMAAALLDPPRFEEVGQSVVVTLLLAGPVTPRERGWVADLEKRGDLQAHDRLLLVHAARGETLTNAVGREILSADALGTRRSLKRLTAHGFLVQHGSRGGASYTLADDIAPSARYRLSPEQLDELVLESARQGAIANATVRGLTGLSREDALRLLRRLVAAGQLVSSGSRRGTRYSSTT